MYVPLTPCTSCSRHVRHDATHCPFCDQELSSARPIARDTTKRLTRAAAFMFGTAALACGSDVTVGDTAGSSGQTSGQSGTQSSTTTGSQMAATSTSTTSGGGDGGNIAPPYGIPGGGGPGGEGGDGGDGGAGGAGGSRDLYGAPPPPDPEP